MKLYSTNRKSPPINFKEAVLMGQAPDGGLYIPETLPIFADEFIQEFSKYSLKDIAKIVTYELLKDELTAEEVSNIVNQAIYFDAPLHKLSDNLQVLELFCGPTLAFKDFGANFMARLISHYAKDQNQETTILVATSGDTGSAVAGAFFEVESVNVKILYPSKKVSPLQELQLTTWGKNITAYEVDGTFDDCQKIVKQAFSDEQIKKKLNLSSANSINIARLIPQSFYYFYSFSRLSSKTANYSVPSGNFGNLTAGLIAKKMGLPINKFIASTNANNIVPEYFTSGNFVPKASVATISNAMDVGNPSNLVRMQNLYLSLDELKKDVWAISSSDEETKNEITEIYKKFNYLICPHTAVGLCGIKKYLDQNKSELEIPNIVLGTAHPAKFKEVVEETLGFEILLPDALEKVKKKKKESILIKNTYQSFLDALL